MNLHEVPIEELPSTRPQTIKKLKALGISTLLDMLKYTPFRYEDYTRIVPIKDLKEGETVTVQGKILKFTPVSTRTRLTMQKARIADSSGELEITWFNQPYLLNILRSGMTISIAGNVKLFGNKLTLDPKEYEILQNLDQPLRHTGRLVPVYSTTHGLSTKLVREKMALLFEKYLDEEYLENMEFLPEQIIEKFKLLPEGKAYDEMHFPATLAEAERARDRLAFDELFTVQLTSIMVKDQWKKDTVGNAFKLSGKKNGQALAEFITKLPFELTGAQKNVTDYILNDLEKTTPMNRFVQGDVGSGKTVVAAIATYAAHINNFQTIIMAPTEILAQQHFNTISKLLEQYNMRVGLHTRSHKLIKKPQQLDEYDVIIGTHALLTEKISFKKVGLVVIDEQHRFGVAQRAALKAKGYNPHLLTMTATPIPRTVALTLYGELDLSVIDEMPKGRLPIKSAIVPDVKREKAYAWINDQIRDHGIQVFVICPLIEESETESMTSVKAATKEYEYLKKTVFKDKRVILIHGKMKAAEKDQVMADFKAKKFDILVSTSVVEVGIDIPNATIMIIEGAERYGLAQLHQLRGRVGRGDKQSYCFLFTTNNGQQYSKRLKYFAQTTNGMHLAEYDMQNRGVGEVYGTKQSGMDELQYADLTNLPLIESTKKAAELFFESYRLDKYPELARRIDQRTHRIAKD
jgi:ATP-dependent DNA helicase RecG